MDEDLKDILKALDNELGNSIYCLKTKCYNCKIVKICSSIALLREKSEEEIE